VKNRAEGCILSSGDVGPICDLTLLCHKRGYKTDMLMWLWKMFQVMRLREGRGTGELCGESLNDDVCPISKPPIVVCIEGRDYESGVKRSCAVHLMGKPSASAHNIYPQGQMLNCSVFIEPNVIPLNPTNEPFQ
jgi:hypothetical protein